MLRKSLYMHDLIVPYRFDIILRRRMIKALEATPPEDSQDILDLAHETGYAIWFEEVEVARFRPELSNDPTHRERSLLERARGLLELMQSLRNTGKKPLRPPNIYWHILNARADSNPEIAFRYSPGGGCHRLAALSSFGVTQLIPQDYKLKPRFFRPILDNTVLLLNSGRIGGPEITDVFCREHNVFSSVLSGETSEHPRFSEMAKWSHSFLG